MRRIVLAELAPLAALVVAPACAPSDGRPAAPRADTVPAVTAAPAAAPVARKPASPAVAPLSATADTISRYLVFAPTNQGVFLAAARGGRLLVDVGRVDLEVRKDPRRTVAYREAVERMAPMPVGARLRLRAAWGAEDVTVTGFDTWNGRIVAPLAGASKADSLGRVADGTVAVVAREEKEAGRDDAACKRPTPPADLQARLQAVGDSLQAVVRAVPAPREPRLAASLKLSRTGAVGCFGAAHQLVAVSLRAGNNEWVQERMVLVDDAGQVRPLRVNDGRFKAHDLLGSLDADGDGVDDVVTRAAADGMGATTVLRLDDKSGTLARWVAGFGWEVAH